MANFPFNPSQQMMAPANLGQTINPIIGGSNGGIRPPSQMQATPSNVLSGGAPMPMMQAPTSLNQMNSFQPGVGGANGGVRFPQQQFNPMNAVSTQQVQAQGLNQFNPTQPGLNNGSNGGVRFPQQFQQQNQQWTPPTSQGINPNQIQNAPGMQQPSLQMNPQVSPGSIQNAPPGLAPSANVFNQSPQINPGSIQNAPPGMAPSANLFNNTPTQSVEQQALGGGSNAQQVQNFMQALQGVGAGTNNTFQNAASNNPQQQQAAPLYPSGSQPSDASSGNNVQGYYNTGTGNMQQSSSNNWNQGGQVNGSSSPINTTNAAPSLNPMNAYPASGSSQLGASLAQNAINPNSSQLGVGGSNGGVQMQRQQFNPTQASQAPANVIGAGGLAGLVSDRNAKTNIEPAKKDLTQFLGKLGVHKYEYKDPANGEGEFVSVMAQELEKTKLGKSAVEMRPDGLKQIQYGRLSGITLAATALLHQRLGEIEKKLKIKANK